MKPSYTIIIFYKFAKVRNPEKFREQQREIAESFALKGRILVGEEGINGTLEGTTKNIASYVRAQHKTQFFKNVPFKESEGNGKAFPKLKVKVREEIVTLGAGKFDVRRETAKTITADQFDKLYEKGEDFAVLDLRNQYEVDAGYFEKTINPGLKNFRDLPKKLKKLAKLKDKKVVAVCTAGIRCEKATCLLKREGFTDIYQLKDGIQAYMKKFPGKRFKGSLFVFDNRMTTPLVDTEDREITGRCAYCKVGCEEFYNDDAFRPSKKIICCDNCIPSHMHHLRKCIMA